MKNAVIIRSALLMLVWMTIGVSILNSDTIDRLISRDTQTMMGISKLTVNERKKLDLFLTRLVATLAGSGDLARAAQRYLEKEGWEEVEVVDVRSYRGSDWMVVEVSPLSTWIIEVPFGFRPSMGKYWGKTAPFSGLSAILDSDGTEHSLAFCDSKELR